ncbi:MAG: class I SAM-dependent methyltransferase, partial [Bacteroidota bacterium]
SFLNPKMNAKYLDIGCGTGNYTIALQKKGFNFIGMDPSQKMITRAKELYPDGEWVLGKAEKTQLADNTIDGILASLTVHHWSDLVIAFGEFNRVLKNSGKIVVFTSTSEQMKGYWLNHYFPKMLLDSIVQMPNFEVIQ